MPAAMIKEKTNEGKKKLQRVSRFSLLIVRVYVKKACVPRPACVCAPACVYSFVRFSGRVFSSACARSVLTFVSIHCSLL